MLIRTATTIMNVEFIIHQLSYS